MDINLHDITERFAYQIYKTFEDAGLPNDSDGNWREASFIIVKILNSEYKLDEFKSFFSMQDYEHLKTHIAEVTNE